MVEVLGQLNVLFPQFFDLVALLLVLRLVVGALESEALVLEVEPSCLGRQGSDLVKQALPLLLRSLVFSEGVKKRVGVYDVSGVHCVGGTPNDTGSSLACFTSLDAHLT